MFNPYQFLASRPQIELRFKLLPASLQGYYASYQEDTLIVLNRSLSQVERRCVLTEELGHYVLGHSGNYFLGKYSGGLSPGKQEVQAKTWAADRLIDTTAILSMMRRDHQHTVDEICESLWVTRDTLFFKLQRLVNLGYLSHFFMPDIT